MTLVKDILETKPFENAILVAGANGLSNQVKTITVAELPDASDWLRGGEVICTTGFLIKNQSHSQVNWVKSMIENKAAALAIKTSRFLGEVPEAIKCLANARAFPIISLPNDVTWPYIIEAVMNLINAEQVGRLQRAKEIQEQLTQLVLDENDVSRIAQSLSDLLGFPIVLEDGRLNLITTAIPSHVEAKKKEEARTFIQVRTNDVFLRKLLQSDYYRYVFNHRTKEIGKIPLHQPYPANTLMMPILASNVIYGFLTLIQVGKDLVATDVVALEQGASAVALQLVKESLETKSRHDKEQETVQNLIHGRFSPSGLGQGYFPQIDWSSPMVVVLINGIFETMEEGLFVVPHTKQKMESIIKESVRLTFGECIVGYAKNQFTVLVTLKGSTSKEVLNQMVHTMEYCLAGLKQYSSGEIQIAIGGIYSSRAKLQKSFEDAKKTLDIMQIIPSLGPVASFDLTGIYRLIHKIDDYQFLRNFRDDYLSEIMDYDDTLCGTLRTYLLVGGNVTATAKQLFVHPNTVMYRLRKIKSITGSNLDNPQYRDSLLFALEIHNYLRTLEK